MKTIITKNEKETFALGKKIAKTLKGGEIIGLVGDLGAGKTIFTKGIAKGLGVNNTITSPTFVLMKVYPVKKHDKIKQLVHIDAYRLDNSTDLENIGINDYSDKSSVIIIEWADKIYKNDKFITIKFIIDNKKRFLTMTI